ncbi:Hypothetical protein D9617_1g080350 [Elsinoe fawcettii]|nr:Hypothetical protein D9617_1g080350 [Elsinoe fawcettii]
MRSILITSAFAAMVLAAPRPQDIEIDAVEAQGLGIVDGPPLAAAVVEEVPTYNADAAAASATAVVTEVAKRKRQASTRPPLTTTPATTPSTTPATTPSTTPATTPSTTVATTSSTTSKDPSACTPLPQGSGPVPSPDTASRFLSDPQFTAIADSAVVPDGYTKAFSGLQGATEGSGYLGYYTLKSYNPVLCQQWCDKTSGCTAFNIYIERDPTVNPAPACKNPASTSNIKCSLWGLEVSSTTATNRGQWRYDFQVAITASNGYNSVASPAPADGFTGPVKDAGAIQAPDSSYMLYKYFSGPYNPSACATACLAQTDYNKKHPKKDGTYDTCSFFNSYVLSKNGAPQGTYCSLYTKAWSPQYATNYGQYRGSDYYSVSQSYGWTLVASD